MGANSRDRLAFGQALGHEDVGQATAVERDIAAMVSASMMVCSTGTPAARAASKSFT